MRTTLTLDDDVAKQLERETRRSGNSFKEVVNHFLRIGLTAGNRPQGKPFVVKPRKMGLPEGLSYDNVADLLDHLEGPGRR